MTPTECRSLADLRAAVRLAEFLMIATPRTALPILERGVREGGASQGIGGGPERFAALLLPVVRDLHATARLWQTPEVRAFLDRIDGDGQPVGTTDPIVNLFHREVSELRQGVVLIRAIAREAGSRTKIAVSSRDDAIDPVGACVGLKGSRVQAVVNELGGERIDIVPWSPDPERFIRLALFPARVTRVYADPATKASQAIVDEDQLSRAIGRNGQNVRLASELTGWTIDLYTSAEWAAATDGQPVP